MPRSRSLPDPSTSRARPWETGTCRSQRLQGAAFPKVSMSNFLTMLSGAAGAPIDDVITLAETRPQHRPAAIATGITLGLVAVACPVPFLLHAVVNLTAAGVREAEREARLAGADLAGADSGSPGTPT
jgi:hypothetical protein